MPRSLIRTAQDYNRGVARPIRWLHMTAAALEPVFGPAARWAWDERRRLMVVPLVVAALLTVMLARFDGPVMTALANVRFGGDLLRELRSLQQWGGAGFSILAVCAILLLDRKKAPRLLDWVAAAAATGLVMLALKMLIGRPRPEFADPLVFLGPLGQYPLDPQRGVRHAWEIWAGISSDLWSMPSSHTSAAVVMSVALTALYPRLAPLGVAMVVLVGAARVLFREHYPTDVIVGAAVGFAIARAGMDRSWGRRLAARLSGRVFVDDHARARWEHKDSIPAHAQSAALSARITRAPEGNANAGASISSDIPSTPKPAANVHEPRLNGIHRPPQASRTMTALSEPVAAAGETTTIGG